MSLFFFILALIHGDVFAQARPKDFSQGPTAKQQADQFRLYCGRQGLLDAPGVSEEKLLMAGLIYDLYPQEGEAVGAHKAFARDEDSNRICLKISGVPGNTSRTLMIDLTQFKTPDVKLEFSAISATVYNAVVTVNMKFSGEKIQALCDEIWTNISVEGKAVSTEQRPNQAVECKEVLADFHADQKRLEAVQDFLRVLIETADTYRKSKGQASEVRIRKASEKLLEINATLGVRKKPSLR